MAAAVAVVVAAVAAVLDGVVYFGDDSWRSGECVGSCTSIWVAKQNLGGKNGTTTIPNRPARVVSAHPRNVAPTPLIQYPHSRRAWRVCNVTGCDKIFRRPDRDYHRHMFSMDTEGPR